MAEVLNKSLNSLILETESFERGFSVYSVQARELEFQNERLVFGDQVVNMSQSARDRLFGMVGAPVSYWKKRSQMLQVAAITEHASRGDLGHRPTLVVRGGEVINIVRGELLRLPNSAVLRAMQEAMGTDGESLTVARIERDEQRMEVELVSASRAVDVRVGDIVMGGIHIIHGWHDDQPTQIQSFLYRLVCSNGMTRRECASRDGIVRTRKLPVNYPNARELQLKQIRRLALHHWNGLQSQLEALAVTIERPAHVEELLTRWLQRARISAAAMMPRLLSAWEQEGAENTHYGAVNALTRVATHDRSLSWRQRRTLASLGGLLAFSEVHICPRCFSVLSGGAGSDA